MQVPVTFFCKEMPIISKTIQVSVLLILFSLPGLVSANTKSLTIATSGHQYLSIADSSHVGLDLSSSFTLEAWVKLASYPVVGTWATIIGKTAGGSSPDRAYGWYIENKNGGKRILLEVHDNNTVEGSIAHSVQYDLEENVWYHLAVTYDLPSGSAIFYVNGIPIGTTSGGAVGGINNNSQSFSIGRLSDSDPYSFDGRIDEVRIWDVVRTQDEINEHKSMEIDTEAHLIGYWQFNGDAYDSSGAENNLIAYNGASFSEDVPFGTQNSLTELLKKVRWDIDEVVDSRALRKVYLVHLEVFEKLYGRVQPRISIKQLIHLKTLIRSDVQKRRVEDSAGVLLINDIDKILEKIRD